MKKYISILIICLIIAIISPKIVNSSEQNCTYNPNSYQGLELSKLTEELANTGLIGNIHGAAAESQLYVMSVREPDNFFNHREFSLIPQNTATQKQLEKVNRHDRICLQGTIINNPSPQIHIKVNSVQVLEPWQQPEGFSPYQRQVNLPAELSQQTSFIGKVHAIGAAGNILVVEYQDGVIPIYVTNTKLTKNLYRGDIVKLSYQIQQHPQQPIHLQLDDTAEKPIEVLDAIASWHNQATTLTGNLVKFPRSPQLKFDVYAIEVDTQGIKRYFTLVNFENIETFTQIREKLAKIWDEYQETAVTGRNMLINPAIQIEASGIINLVSPEQANPQILLKNSEQIKPLISKNVSFS